MTRIRIVLVVLALAAVVAALAVPVAPASHPGPNGAGTADAWLDAHGDNVYGDLRIAGSAALRLNDQPLLSPMPGVLTFSGRTVCLAGSGCQGAPGPAGPTGPAGPLGLTWRGAYAAGLSYAARDAVAHLGSSYVTMTATTVAPPSAPWQILAAKGEGTSIPTGWVDDGAVVRLDASADSVGIGTSTPTAKLHVAQADLAGKGSHMGVRAMHAMGASNHAQNGTVDARLGTVAGFDSSGVVEGVSGHVTVNRLNNGVADRTSTGVGGRFTATLDTPLTSPSSGTYWLGGLYSQVTGLKDAAAPASGAIAAVIGHDTTTGSAPSWAGFFQGRGHFSGPVGIGTKDTTSLLTVDGSGYLQFKTGFAGAPPLADCDAASEQGRLALDTLNNRLYVCFGAGGWKSY